MNKPYLRNPDIIQELPWRKWLRNGFESMPFPLVRGLNVQDVDLAVVRYGELADRHLYDDGILRLFEIKQLNGQMSQGQTRLFSMMDRMLRAGDPEGKNYDGFYFLHWEPPDNCKLNGQRLTMDELKDFLLGKLDIAPVLPEVASEKRRQGIF